MRSKNAFILLLLVFGSVVFTQAQQKIHAADFKFAVENTDNSLKVGEPAEFLIKVKPMPGWHIYSAIPSEEGAYSPTEIGYEMNSAGFEAIEGIGESGSMHSEMDDIMGGMVRYYGGPVVFSQKITITETEVRLVGYVDYMACDDYKCITLTEEFDVTAKAAE